MNFGCRNGGRDAAVGIALEKSDGLLPRCVIAKCVMHLGINQAGNGNGAVGVDDDVTGFESFARDGPHFEDLSIGHKDRVALSDGIFEFTVNDCPEINDCGFHRQPPTSLSSYVAPTALICIATIAQGVRTCE